MYKGFNWCETGYTWIHKIKTSKQCFYDKLHWFSLVQVLSFFATHFFFWPYCIACQRTQMLVLSTLSWYVPAFSNWIPLVSYYLFCRIFQALRFIPCPASILGARVHFCSVAQGYFFRSHLYCSRLSTVKTCQCMIMFKLLALPSIGRNPFLIF